MTRVREVDLQHLVKEHGIDPKAMTIRQPRDRAGQQRHLALFYEMQHAADHAQRRVGHEHDNMVAR